MAEKRPRPVASPLRLSTVAFGAGRKAACAKVAKVAKKVAKVVKVVKVAKDFAKAPTLTGRSKGPKGPKGPVKAVKLVIRRRVDRKAGAQNDTVRKALELYETL